MRSMSADSKTEAIRFDATYFDGKTAQSRDVSVSVSSASLTLSDLSGNFVASWDADRIIFAEKPRNNEPLRLGLSGTTARLISSDANAQNAVLAVAPRAGRSTRVSRRAALKIAGWSIGAIGATAIVVWVLIPLLSAQLARQTPEPVKSRIGSATLAQITKLIAYLPGETEQAQYCHGRDGLDAFGTMTGRILAGMINRPEIRLVVLDAKLVNAFALPGGYIVATSGLIETAKSAEEVAGVIAHEIGHVHHQHPTQAIYSTTAVSVLISGIIGDFSGGVLITGIAEWALNSSYSRNNERDADRFAISRLNAAGIDGHGLGRFFARLTEQSKDKSDRSILRFLSSHPPSDERMALIRDTGSGGGKVLDASEWKALRQVCEVTGHRPARFPVIPAGQ
jgi:beta-barrel assembly-enhancing protease